MKAGASGSGDAAPLDAAQQAATAAGAEPGTTIAAELQDLSISDPSDAARQEDVEEEEAYVQVRIMRMLCYVVVLCQPASQPPT